MSAQQRNNSVKEDVVKPDRPIIGERVPSLQPVPSASPSDLGQKGKCSTAGDSRGSPGRKAGASRCRDHILHLLALRPYKKLEILARLQKDRTKTKDFYRILQQVANLKMKDNSYYLKEYLYQEVKIDWHGYTADEKMQLEQILVCKLKSPSVSRPEEPMPSSQEVGGSSDVPVSKPSLELSFNCMSSPEDSPSHNQSSCLDQSRGCPPMPNNNIALTSTDRADQSEGSVTTRKRSRGKESQTLTVAKTTRTDQESKKAPAHSTEVSTTTIPDYMEKYTTIVSTTQRQSYIEDYRAEYDEYMTLQPLVESVTRRFTQLNIQFRILQPGTKEHQAVQEEVHREFNKLKQTHPNYMEMKDRCFYLYNKLAHIQRLIAQFDRWQNWVRDFCSDKYESHQSASNTPAALPSSSRLAHYFRH